MRVRNLLLALAALTGSCALSAQTKNEGPWVGVWQGDLDGQPGVTITLVNDTGKLEGTVVFNLVVKERNGAPEIRGRDAHLVRNVNVSDDSLQFQIAQPRLSRTIHIEMHRIADGKATLQCVDCGDGPKAVITRLN